MISSGATFETAMGPEACFDGATEVIDLVDEFVDQALVGIGEWASKRTGSDLRFDDAALNTLLSSFRHQLVQLEPNANAEGTPTPLQSWPELQGTLRRRLDVGVTKSFVNEVRVFNSGALSGFAEILGLQTDAPVLHHYEIFPTTALEGGIKMPIGPEAAGEFGEYVVRYTNDLGMQWEHKVVCGQLGGGLAAGVFGYSINSKTGADGHLSTSTMTSNEYYGPEFFADLGFLALDASASALAVGQGLGMTTYTDGERVAYFDSSGPKSSGGTGSFAESSITAQAGSCWTTAAGEHVLPDQHQLPQSPDVAPDEWTRVARLTIPFNTGESAPNADGHNAILDLVDWMNAHDTYEAYRIAAVGSASNRWRGDTGGADPTALNRTLAQSRADVVGTLIEAAVSETPISLDTSIELVEATRDASSEDQDDDHQADRVVTVLIEALGACG